MLKVTKFGGSSMADAGQYRKVRDIVLADKARRVVVVSAAGKRDSKDHKLTDLLYLCFAHIQYGVDCTPIYDMITSRYLEIRDELGLQLDLESEFAALRKKLDKKEISQDELVSRGEYFSAKLLAALLDFQFVDAADWIRFNFDGTVNKESSYSAFCTYAKKGKGIVTPASTALCPMVPFIPSPAAAVILPVRWQLPHWMRISMRTGRMFPAFSWQIPGSWRIPAPFPR